VHVHKQSSGAKGRRIGRAQPFIPLVERCERRIDVIQFYAIIKALGGDPEQAFSDPVARLPDIREVWSLISTVVEMSIDSRSDCNLFPVPWKRPK
jgi:hypothetical protein